MARVLMTLLGLALLALGVWLTFWVWPGQVLMVLAGCLALGVLIVGLVVTLFGISEFAGAQVETAKKAGEAEASTQVRPE